MSFTLMQLLALLLCMRQEAELVISVRKFVYQKDMSEHCRRRVMPSVFLGRHVVAAHAQVLHFSQLEVPYSCFISIRAESGSNIILVIQLAMEESLATVCQKHGDQVVVHEMGETFGGYWGALPESVLRQDSVTQKHHYTIKTTTPTTTTETDDTDHFNYVDGEEPSTSTVKLETPTKVSSEGDYLRMEIPLVNVSGRLVTSDARPEKVFGADENFDLIYDVTPSEGVQYLTKILPLVQFSVSQQPKLRARTRANGPGSRQEKLLYELEYDLEKFTPDPRLSYLNIMGNNTNKRKHNFSKRYRYDVNRRLNFKKKKTPLVSTKRTPLHLKKQTFTNRPFDHYSPNFLLSTTLSEKSIEDSNKQWKYIDDLMETLNNKSLNHHRSDKDDLEFKNTAILLSEIANMQHNFSAYLSSNLSLDSERTTEVNTAKNIPGSFTNSPLPTKIYKETEVIETASTTIRNSVSTEESTLGITIYSSDLKRKKSYSETSNREWFSKSTTFVKDSMESKNYFVDLATIHMDLAVSNRTLLQTTLQLNISSTRTTLKTGSLVNHESWENVVQSAPVMARLLNNSSNVQRKNKLNANSSKVSSNNKLHDNSSKVSSNNKLYDNSSKVSSNNKLHDNSSKVSNVNKMNDSLTVNSSRAGRTKRHIQAIPVEIARPHTHTTRADMSTAPDYVYKFADMQNFARLVELNDDEIHGRIALRYLRRHVGGVLFNMCDYSESKARHVLLFNSSRLLIAINNFTLKQMTVVATSAQTLTNADMRCSQQQIECQVSGARVCIDALAACDGVPNCGAHDIYDEDRLRCGASKGVQHNVYLAAFTFLAVLLTVFYTVHYWLKRCVPTVSDAFFVYTDGSENVLFLDSIMRSPNDIDEDHRLVYQSNLYQGIDPEMHKTKNYCMKKLKKMFGLLRSKRVMKLNESVQLDECAFPGSDLKRFSFTESQLHKMIRPESVEVSVQTGESLELQFINALKRRKGSNDSVAKHVISRGEQKIPIQLPTAKEYIQQVEMDELSHDMSYHSDLSILKFFRDIKSSSAQIIAAKIPSEAKQRQGSSIDLSAFQETELHSTDYEHADRQIDLPSTSFVPVVASCEVHPETSGRSGLAKKHLRFKESLVMSSQELIHDDDQSQKMKRGSFVRAGRSNNNQELDTIEEDSEHSSGRDFRRFWSNPRGKKPKKKQNVKSLR